METAVADLMELLTIPGVSTEEDRIADYLEARLVSFGVERSAITRDRTFEQSEYGGRTGNIIVRFPGRGDHPGRSRLFMTHIDTVALVKDPRPRVLPAEGDKPRRIANDNPASALGADCRTGCGVLLQVARHLASTSGRRPPVWMVFTVQEELGLVGARGLDLAALKPDPPGMGFNYDGGRPWRIIHAVIGTSRFFVDLHGKAAHAGINPADGVSAAVAAAKAIADMARAGYHGRIDKPEGKGSANVGILSGGQMTNTVMDKLVVRGEVRSHDPGFRRRLLDLYRQAFEQAAADTRNAAGEPARVEWSLGPCYDSFAIPEDAPVVRAAQQAVREHRLTPELEVNDGGMDANWINVKGLPTVTMGTGQFASHSVNEWINVDEYLAACRIALTIATQ